MRHGRLHRRFSTIKSNLRTPSAVRNLKRDGPGDAETSIFPNRLLLAIDDSEEAVLAPQKQ
jgi:hypothetical protein